MQSPDERKLWKEIDWSGNYEDKKASMIPIHCMADYFETLYQPVDRDEVMKLNNLETAMSIPITDDPITYLEVNAAVAKMKKGGYDFSLPVLKLLVSAVTFSDYIYEYAFLRDVPSKTCHIIIKRFTEKGRPLTDEELQGNSNATVVSSAIRQNN